MSWLPVESARLLRQLIGVPDDVVRADVPHHPEIWGDLCGRYTVSAQVTDMQARGLTGFGLQVFVRHARLMIRALSPVPTLFRGFPLHPDDIKDPYVFRLDLTELGIGTVKVVFSSEGGAITRVGLDLAPLSARKAD